jgi:uncharacterized protein DUF3179
LLKELSAGLMVVPGEEEARETIQDISLAAYHALSLACQEPEGSHWLPLIGRWQQATGAAIAGEFTGMRLDPRPASTVSWDDFKSAQPNGKVLSRKTGFSRSYGQNPYAGYDDVDDSPFLYEGPKTPDTLPPMARVITVDSGGEAVAYPYDMLRRQRVVNDTVGGKPAVVLWAPGTASALDEDAVAAGRDVGSAAVFSRILDGTTLTFRSEGGRIVDEQTGTEWNALGRALEGELTGEQLARVVSIDHFWFSWAAFRSDTRIYKPQSAR